MVSTNYTQNRKEHGLFSQLFIGPRNSWPGFRPCTMDWGFPDQSLIRKLYYRHAYRTCLTDAFSQLMFLLPKWLLIWWVAKKKKLAKNIIVQINQQCTFPSSYTHIFINFNIATGKVDSNYESFSLWTDHHGNRSTFLLSVSGPQFILEQTRASSKA